VTEVGVTRKVKRALDPSSTFFGTDLSLGKDLLRATASCHKFSERFD
jgi:hypothetical protein